MKDAASATRVDRATAKEARRTRVTKALTDAMTSFKRLVDSRLRKVERRMEEEIGHLREELHASEIVLAAARLRALNERQSHDGLGWLRADLRAMREMGIVDEKGNRIKKDPPAQILGDTYDA